MCENIYLFFIYLFAKKKNIFLFFLIHEKIDFFYENAPATFSQFVLKVFVKKN